MLCLGASAHHLRRHPDSNPSILISFASANVLSGVHFGRSPNDLSTYYAAEAKTISTINYLDDYLYKPNLGQPDATVEQLALELDTTSFGMFFLSPFFIDEFR